MSLTAFMATENDNVLEIFDETMREHGDWRRELLELVSSWGFDTCTASDFKGPDELFLKRNEEDRRAKGPDIDGFKGGDRRYVENFGPCFSYQIHGRSKWTKELKRQVEELKKVHTPDEHKDDFFHEFGGVKGLICRRIGQKTEVIDARSIRFSSCYKLAGKVVVSYPFDMDRQSSLYDIPAIPDGWVELTATEVAALFNAQNSKKETSE